MLFDFNDKMGIAQKRSKNVDFLIRKCVCEIEDVDALCEPAAFNIIH